MKLSVAQQRIVDMMKDGWQLKSNSGPDAHVWLARVIEGKLQTITVSSASLHRLYRLGLIGFERNYPINNWELYAEKHERN